MPTWPRTPGAEREATAAMLHRDAGSTGKVASNSGVGSRVGAAKSHRGHSDDNSLTYNGVYEDLSVKPFASSGGANAVSHQPPLGKNRHVGIRMGDSAGGDFGSRSAVIPLSYKDHDSDDNSLTYNGVYEDESVVPRSYLDTNSVAVMALQRKKDSLRIANRRKNYTDEEKEQQRVLDRARKAVSRNKGTPEQIALVTSKKRKKTNDASETTVNATPLNGPIEQINGKGKIYTDEDRERHRILDRARKAVSRSRATPEQIALVNSKRKRTHATLATTVGTTLRDRSEQIIDTRRRKAARLNATAEELQRVRDADLSAKMAAWNNSTDEQRQRIRDANTAARMAARNNLTDEQRQRIRDADSTAQMAAWNNLTEEQRQRIRDADSTAQMAAWNNLTEEQRQRIRNADSTAQMATWNNLTDEQRQEVRDIDWDRLRQARADAMAASPKIIPNFSTPIPDLRKAAKLEFSQFECNIETAVVLHHLNRGILQFSEDPIEMVLDVQNEILTPEQQTKMITDFRKQRMAMAPILSCGACGIKNSKGGIKNDKPCKEMKLSDLSALQITGSLLEDWKVEKQARPISIPTCASGDWREINVYSCRSVYESSATGACFHLHPELVATNADGQETTFVCQNCLKALRKEDLPRFSIANGVDFGYSERLNLVELNLVEQTIVALVRIYRKILKIGGSGRSNLPFQQNTLKSHMIAFGHDAPTAAANVFDPKEFRDSMMFVFHGENSKVLDALMQETFGRSRVKARGFALYQHLSVLKVINPYYRHLNVPSLDRVEAVADEINAVLKESSLSVVMTKAQEATIGADVANVREDAAEMATAASPQAVFVTGHNLVADTTTGLLQAVADAVGVDVFEDVKTYRESTPMNDFWDNDKLLCKAFPFIFMFGTAYDRPGGLHFKEMQHLLNQFTNIPAVNKELCFLLQNQKGRHGNAAKLSGKVKGNRYAFEKFSAIVVSAKFRMILHKAMKDPTSKYARWILKKMLPVLQVGGEGNPLGSFATGKVASHIYGMSRHFGPGSVFFTIAPDDINNPKTLRLAQRVMNNTSYPAVVENVDQFLDAMATDATVLSEGDIALPVGWKSRCQAATSNSVATSVEYMDLIEHVWGILLGITPESKSRRTTYFLQAPKGVFGHLSAGLAVNEVQARGSLHMHLICYGGLRPELLQRAGDFPNVCKAVAEALDSMYCAQMPRENHVYDLVLKNLDVKERPIKKYPAASCVRINHVDQVEEFCYDSVQHISQIHVHGCTCKKPPTGLRSCRLAQPSANREDTAPCLLQKLECVLGPDPVKGKKEDYPCCDYEVRHEMGVEQNQMLGPIKGPDDRVIAWELRRPTLEALEMLPLPDENEIEVRAEWRKRILEVFRSCLREDHWETVRTVLITKEDGELDDIYKAVASELPDRNGFLVNFNKVVTACTGSNTCALPLGNTCQSNGACFYLTNYMAKNKTVLAHTLVVLEKALIHVTSDAGASVADDAGTPTRTAQHFITRTLNKLDLAMEISDSQATASLLGLTTEISTHLFKLVGIHEAVNYMGYFRHQQDDDEEGSHQGDKLVNNELSGYESDDGFVLPEDTDDPLVPCEMINNAMTVPAPQDPTVNATGTSPNISLLEAEILVQQYDFDDGNKWGPASIYHIDERGDGTGKTPVHVCFPEHYHYRGKAFRHLNREEYTCTIGMQVKSKNCRSKSLVRQRKNQTTGRQSTESDSEDDNEEACDEDTHVREGAGRPKSPQFSYGKGFKLEATHAQYILSKQMVPVHTGKLPPFPDMNDQPAVTEASYEQWRKKADAFGAYYLVAYRPEPEDYDDDHRDPGLRYDYQAFCVFVEELRNATDFLSFARLDKMTSTMFAMKTKNEVKVMLNHFRRRAVSEWSILERQEGEVHWKNAKAFGTTMDDVDGFFNLEDQKLSSSSLSDASQLTLFSRDVVLGLSGLDEMADHSQSMGRAQNTQKITHVPVNVKTMYQMYDGMLRPGGYVEEECDDESDDDSPIHDARPSDDFSRRSAKAMKIVNDPFWNQGQRRLLKHLHDTLTKVHHNNGEPFENGNGPIVLCTGGPGTGKTTVLKKFADIAVLMGLDNVIKTTYMGVAAVQAGGLTIVKFMMLGRYSDTSPPPPLEKQRLQDFRYQLGLTGNKKVAIFIIDEISTITVELLSFIDMRLRQATGKSAEPFGGLPIYLFGDFAQISPVCGTSMTTRTMELTEVDVNYEHRRHNSNLANGAVPKPVIEKTTMKTNTKVKPGVDTKFGETSAIRRGVELLTKATWLPLTEQMRCGDDVHSEFVASFQRGEPVTNEKMKHIANLSSHDLEDPEWRFATIGICSNRERLDIIQSQVLRFAQYKGTRVIRWLNPLQMWKGKPKSELVQQLIMDTDPVFWQYFVVGAEAFINHNINSDKKIANGTKVKLHSLTFSTKEEEEYFMQQLEDAMADPSVTTVTLRSPPEFVNVELFYDEPELVQNWKGPTLVKDRVVLPLGHGKAQWYRGGGKKKNEGIWARGGPIFGFAPSKVLNYTLFPFDLAFAVTFHKLQGRTIAKLVLVLSQHPVYDKQLMTYASLFVAFSRVRHGADIRILLPHGMCRLSLAHLELLKPEPTIKQFFSGFGEAGTTWDRMKAFNARNQYVQHNDQNCRHKKRSIRRKKC